MEAMRDECKVLFSQHSKESAVLERKIDKAIEKIGEIATNQAVMNQMLGNHYETLVKNGKNRDKSINRNFKLALSALVVALAGGSIAGAINYIY